jgi:hypothetical protein
MTESSWWSIVRFGHSFSERRLARPARRRRRIAIAAIAFLTESRRSQAAHAQLVELLAHDNPMVRCDAGELSAHRGAHGQEPRSVSDVGTTDAVCQKHLCEEYAELCRKMAAALCRKRPSPAETGQAASWACGIAHAIGSLNFLFDKTQKPHLTA